MAQAGLNQSISLSLGMEEISSMNNLQVLQAALNHSMANGSFIDTKFYCFSRLRRTGVVDKPLPVYANSAVLQIHSSDFDGFSNGFSEGRIASLRGGFPEDKDQFNESYGYDSDSDLDEEEEELELGSDLEQGEASSTSVADQQTGRAADAATPTGIEDTNPQSMGEQVGRIIVIPDVAHATLKAMVHFLYFGTLNFAPVTSAGKLTQRSQLPGESSDSSYASMISSHPWDAPRCSPKSMYRLADKFGLTVLKAKARESIRFNMTTDNITTELRSSITSTYDEIRDMMIQFACERSRLPLVIAMIPEWLEELATGRIPRAASTLAALIQKVTTLPPPTLTHHLPCSVCRNPLNMNQSQCYCHHCQRWQSPEASNSTT